MQSYSSLFQKTLLKIVLYGIPIFYFLMAVSFYLKTYDSAQIKITLLHVMGLFLIMSWLVLKIEQGDFGFLKKNFLFILPVVLFLISGLVSFALSSFPYASFNEAVKRFIYCAVAIILVSEFHDEKNISRILNWLIAATFIATLYGVLQMVDFHLTVAGVLAPMPAKGLDPFIWRMAFYNRILSTFGNPNFFGDFLIVMFPIALGQFIHKKRLYLLFLVALILACIIHTFSKGAWLGVSAGTFTFAVLYLFIFKRDVLTKRLLTVSIVAVVLVISVAFTGIYKFSMQRTTSISFRVFTWLTTWDMINTKPVLGTGIGSFYVTYPSFRRPQIFFVESKHNNESDHPENEYLEVWFDEGIIGFTIFLTLIIFVLVLGVKNMRYLHSSQETRAGPMAYIQLGVTTAFASQLAHDATCVSLRFVSSGIMFWLLIGLTLAIAAGNLKNYSEKTEHKDIFKKPVKRVLQLIIIIAFLFLIKYLAGYFTADLLHSRAITYSRMGQYDLAIKTYDEVIRLNPSFPMSRYFKANVHLDRWKAGDSVKAENEFRELWKLAPEYVQSKYLAGLMYSKLFEGALITRNESIRSKQPANVISQQNAKVVEYFNKAVSVFSESIMVDPIYPLTYYRLSALYAMAGDLGTAEKILYSHLQYVEKLQKHPHDFWKENWQERVPIEYSETYFQLGNLYANNDVLGSAVRMYQTSISLYPEHILSRKNLATVYTRQGNTQAARQQWLEVNKLDPKDEDAKRYLGIK